MARAPQLQFGPANQARGIRLASALVSYLAAPAVIAGLMLWYLLASRQAVGEFGFPLDDSWIHVRFAQNLARGHGFSFNPGQPASTTTGPLWTLILALGYRLTGDYLFTSAALNWLFCVLAAVTAGALARTIVPNPAFGAAAVLLVAVTVPLPWLGLSGMEPPLAVWLTVLGILLHIRFRRAGPIKSVVPTLVFGLAVYSRPELVLLFPLALLDRLIMAAQEQPGQRYVVPWLKNTAIHAPLFAAIIAPLVIYNEGIIGRPFPSSYYIKAWNFGITWALAMQDDRLLMQSLLIAPIKEIGALLLMWAGNNIALIVPFLYGFVRLIRAPLSLPHRSLLIPLLLFTQPVAWAVSTNFHRAPWFQSQRYVANLGPLYLTVGLAGAWWLWEQRAGQRRRPLLVAGLAFLFAASLARQPDQARMYALNVKNITELQVETGRWLKQHVPQQAFLALNDVGAIAVISGSRVYDMMGLVSPESLACLTLERARNGTWRACLRETMERLKPDYFVAISRPESLRAYEANPDLRAAVYRREIKDNITAGGPVAVVYPTIWCRYPVRISADREPRG